MYALEDGKETQQVGRSPDLSTFLPQFAYILEVVVIILSDPSNCLPQSSLNRGEADIASFSYLVPFENRSLGFNIGVAPGMPLSPYPSQTRQKVAVACWKCTWDQSGIRLPCC